MSTNIGLISDVHATPAPLQEALEIFARNEVETILCAGDIAGYGSELLQTVELLIANRCQVVVGNHDIWWLNRFHDAAAAVVADYLRALPRVIELCAEDRKIHMVHASPPESLMTGIKLLDENGLILNDQKVAWRDTLKAFPFDLLVVGHTHQVFAERLANVLVVNPGSTLFNHTCAILRLPDMEVEIFPLSGKKPVLSWNLAGGVW